MHDNRIPPYGMSRAEAEGRNALPVPATQYGNPAGVAGTYDYFDQVALDPPPGATYGALSLVYQPTSWEYVQFLWRANTGQVTRLAQEGVNLLNAWRNTGMAAPHVMATASWGTPPLSVGDCEVAEGNAGTRTCDFAVSLPAPAGQMVFVEYATADGSATVADGDYDAASGLLSFEAGTTTQTVSVTVNGDSVGEPYETFTLNLANATNATIADGTGTATIVNDDAPVASIGDCSVVEGNAGTTNCIAAITLNAPAIGSPVLEWGTTDFTATAGPDYLASGSFAAFQPGTTTQNVTVPVVGDLLPEIDETFFLWLQPVSGAVTVGDGEGIGTIVDDDGLTGGRAELAHGFAHTTDLAASGGVADRDLYLVAQQPYSSYEVVVDGGSGDLGTAGPLLERRSATDALLQASAPVGTGPSRTLRWQNTSFLGEAGERIVVSATGPGGCGISCGPDDRYRIRFYDTTYSIPRFNNTGSQLTVLLLQNATDRPVEASVRFWLASGALAASQPVSLAPRQLYVLQTQTTNLVGQSGSITIAHDGGHGALSGKTVALEPATGFSFDSPMVPRLR